MQFYFSLLHGNMAFVKAHCVSPKPAFFTCCAPRLLMLPAPTAHRQACSETSPTAQKALLGPLLSPPLPDRQHLIGFKDSTQHLVLQDSQTTERSFSSSPVASRTPEQNCFPAYLWGYAEKHLLPPRPYEQNVLPCPTDCGWVASLALAVECK